MLQYLCGQRVCLYLSYLVIPVLFAFLSVMSDVGGPSKGWMRKGEEGCSIETAM
jgi:hypothetical protein